MEVLVSMMDFLEAVEEIKRIEKNASGRKQFTGSVDLPRTVDFSPEEFVDKDYQALLNEYERMIKIARASGISFKQVEARIEAGESAEQKAQQQKILPSKEFPPLPNVPPLSPPPIPPVEKEIQQMPKATATLESEPQTFEFEKSEELKQEEKKPKVEIESEREKKFVGVPEEKEELSFEHAEEATSKPEPPSSEPLSPKEVSLKRETKEVMGEESEIPYLKHHEPVSLLIPPLLFSSPEEAAERKYAEIEAKIPRAVGEKTDEKEIKKRMIELTKELFKAKTTSERQKIKADIAALRELLARQSELEKRTISFALNFFNMLEVDQKMEIASAKEDIIKKYRSQLSRILESFSSSLKLAKTDDERKAIYDTFTADLETLRVQIKELNDKYQAFFLKEHTIALEKLKNDPAFKGDKYVSEKIAERLKEMKFAYAAEFLALEDSFRKELDMLAKTKKHEVLEPHMSEEMEKVFSIVSAKDEELLNYMHAHYPDIYKEFESGKLSRIELITQARILLAKDVGLKKDIIIKYFGEI